MEKYQNKDGGWGALKGADSEAFVSLSVFDCYRQNRLWRKKPCVLLLEKYLIKNHLSKNQTKNEQDRWNRIHSGYKKNSIFEGGSLLLLENLLKDPLESNSKKVKSLIKWLKDLQTDSGYFPYHAGLESQENLLSTIRALSCIKRYYLLSANS